MKQLPPYRPRQVIVTVPHCTFVLAILKLQRSIFHMLLASPFLVYK
jgi:hypothetical protein